jgi:hypothetical protein
MFSERIEEFDAPAYYFRYRVIDIGPLPQLDDTQPRQLSNGAT